MTAAHCYILLVSCSPCSYGFSFHFSDIAKPMETVLCDRMKAEREWHRNTDYRNCSINGRSRRLSIGVLMIRNL